MFGGVVLPGERWGGTDGEREIYSCFDGFCILLLCCCIYGCEFCLAGISEVCFWSVQLHFRLSRSQTGHDFVLDWLEMSADETVMTAVISQKKKAFSF